MKKNLWILFFFVVVGLQSCKEEIDPVDSNPDRTLGNGFYILNQGNFTSGNASLSYFDEDSAVLYQNLFYETNKVPLGDVAQSMTLWHGKGFIVINNSGIIWVVDAANAAITAKISGLMSPRYLCIIDDEKAYVSDLQIPGITVINPTTMELLDVIHTGKSTENLVLFQNKVFASNWSKLNQTAYNNTIQVIDNELDLMIDSIVVVQEPNSMVLDKNNHLWVLCSGGYLNEAVPALFMLDVYTHEILQRFDFDNQFISPDQLSINNTADTLYFLNDGVYQMSIDDAQLPLSPCIAENGRNYYAMAVNPLNNDIIVSDVGNYIQSGYVFHLKSNGTFVDSLQVGIIPGFIGFNTNE